MTYEEYSKLNSVYVSVMISRKKLIMTIAANKAHLTGYTKIPKAKRLLIIDKAEKQLARLVIPQKPKQPIGFQVLINKEFEGFIPVDDYNNAFAEAKELLGHSNFTLKPELRFTD